MVTDGFPNTAATKANAQRGRRKHLRQIVHCPDCNTPCRGTGNLAIHRKNCTGKPLRGTK